MPSVRQSLPVNLLLALGVTTLLAGALEWSARAWERRHPPPRPAEYLWDWERMWEGDFYTVGSAAVGWPQAEEFNADGVRDSAHAVEKPARTLRVAILGDSVTLGDGLEPAQAYPQVMQAQLEREGRRVEVFNFALWGWSTRQERLAYERLARRYRPDLIVLAVCLNDIPELQNNLSRPPGWLTWLHERWALVRLIVNASGREVQSVEELFEARERVRVTQAFERFFAEVRGLRREVEADGAKLAVIVFPFRMQLEAGAPPARAQQRVAAFCQAEGVTCDDLLPVLAPLGPEAFRDYDHLSPSGSSATAQALLSAAWFPKTKTPGAILGGTSPERLAQALVATAPEERQAALWLAATQESNPRTLAGLQLALQHDDDAGVRAQAAHTLAALQAHAALPALFTALGDDSQSVRWAAAQSLARLQPQADQTLAPMRAALQSNDAYVRGYATWTLGEWGAASAPAVPDLIAALRREDQSPGVAAQALAKIGPAAVEAVPALCETLVKAGSRRRWNAAIALGRIGPGARAHAAGPLVVALRDGDPRVRAQAARALGRMQAADRASIEALRTALADDSDEVRATAARALGWLGAPATPAVPTLNGLLQDPDARVRHEAEKALRRVQEGVASTPDQE